ncbi:hypothetical protein [Geomicrobium sp. JCM 19038]|nr:hypothetical protein [Geomicrobium sp. JCM 19038]
MDNPFGKLMMTFNNAVDHVMKNGMPEKPHSELEKLVKNEASQR